MSNENQGKGINKDLIKELEATEEYKAWQDSLFAIIGYTSNNEDDEDLAAELMVDHLGASFELQKGLEKAGYNAKIRATKELQDDWLLDNSG